MKFHKLSKFSKVAIASTILSGAVLATAIPLLNQVTTTTNLPKAQTGKIIHDADAQVVNNVNDIVVNNIEFADHSDVSTAIIENNGKQEFYVWGRNDYGQLGLNDKLSKSTPQLFDMTQFGAYNTIEIHFGNIAGYSSYAILNTNAGQKLYTWGYNVYGQLGHKNAVNQLVPKEVDRATLGDYDAIEQVIADYYNFYVITVKNNQQQLYICGINDYGQLTFSSSTASLNQFTLVASSKLGNYTAIKKFNIKDASASMVVDTTTGLKLYVWGRNDYGQLGNNGTAHLSSPWLQNQAPFTDIKNLESPNFIFSFAKSSYAWNKDANEVYVWGYNGTGTLGMGDDTNTYRVPTKMTSNVITLDDILMIEITGANSYAYIKSRSTSKVNLYVWGHNYYGQLGLGYINTAGGGGQNNPTAFDLNKLGITDITAIKKLYFPSDPYAERNSYALVEKNNQLEYYTWGINTNLQIVDSIPSGTNAVISPTKIEVPDYTTLVDGRTSYGSTSITVKNSDNKLQTYVRGRNDYGQLGFGTSSSTGIKQLTETTPVRKTDFTVKSFYSVLSAADALNALKATSASTLTKELQKYINTIALPSDAIISILNDSSIDNSKGTINLSIKVDKTYTPLNFAAVVTNTEYKIVIPGFRIAKNLNNAPVVAIKNEVIGLSTNTFYEQVINAAGNVINRPLLEQYVDLTAIPQTAKLHIAKKLPANDAYQTSFILSTDSYYNNDGATFLDNKTFDITINFGYINWGLILGLSIPGLVLILAGIIGGILLVKHKRHILPW